MKDAAILAVDIGTSSIRTSVYVKGKGMALQAAFKQTAESRFSVEALWHQVSDQIKQLTDASSGFVFEAVGVSAFLGWVVVNRDGNAVDQAWGWMARGDRQELDIFRQALPSDASSRIGRKVNEELGVFRWGRILRNCEEGMILLSIKDYINYKLTGVLQMDRTHASYTGLFSIQSNDWDPELLRSFQICRQCLPNLSDGCKIVGTVLPKVAKDLGLTSGAKVALSGPDGSLAIVGSGGTGAGKTIEVMGTTDVLFHVAETVDTNLVVERGLVQNCHLIPGLYTVGGPTGMTGGTLSWWLKGWKWSFESEEYLQMMKTWNARTPAEDGLFVLPLLTGARVPEWNPETRGTVVGLMPSHELADIYKATVEGIAFGTRKIFEQLRPLVSPIDRFTAIGGGARNEVLLRTRASVAGYSIEVPREIEASTFGAVAIAATLTDWYRDVREAVADLNPIAKVIPPDHEEFESYERGYRRYKELIEVLSRWYS